jgi:hypothetical protein
MKRRYGMCCNRGEVNQGKSHPPAQTYLAEQNPENLSWKIKLSGLTSALFFECYQLPPASAG